MFEYCSDLEFLAEYQVKKKLQSFKILPIHSDLLRDSYYYTVKLVSHHHAVQASLVL